MELVSINYEALATYASFLVFLLATIRYLLKRDQKKDRVIEEKDITIEILNVYIRDLHTSHQETLKDGTQIMSRFETVLWRVEKRLEDGGA